MTKKTEFIILGSVLGLKKVETESIRVGNENIKATASVRNIGAFFDKHMKMDLQVKNMCKSAWFHLFNISKIRNYLTEKHIKMVIHAYVTSKLDYNNALLAGATSSLTSKLQNVQNAAAKLITRRKKYDHVTPILQDLHWLPIEYRIIFKILLLTYKSLNGCGPLYLKELLPYRKTERLLRSGLDHLILGPVRTKLKTYGDRSFSAVAVEQWNKLPLELRCAKSVAAFKSGVKTHFFKLYFNN